MCAQFFLSPYNRLDSARKWNLHCCFWENSVCALSHPCCCFLGPRQTLSTHPNRLTASPVAQQSTHVQQGCGICIYQHPLPLLFVRSTKYPCRDTLANWCGSSNSIQVGFCSHFLCSFPLIHRDICSWASISVFPKATKAHGQVRGVI